MERRVGDLKSFVLRDRLKLLFQDEQLSRILSRRYKRVLGSEE